MNDQVVELRQPGLEVLLHAPAAAADLDEGGDYRRRFPNGQDLVDYLNECRFGAIALRFPTRNYWLHLSDSMDPSVVARASDHVRFGVEVAGGQLCVRGSDELHRWPRACPSERLVSLEDGTYGVTACLLDGADDSPIRIYMYFARTTARPDLGFREVPRLFCN